LLASWSLLKVFRAFTSDMGRPTEPMALDRSLA
jgi:hypothetical protein